MKTVLTILLMTLCSKTYCVTDSIPIKDSTMIEINDVNKRIDSYLNINTIGLVIAATGSVMAVVGVSTSEPIVTTAGAVLGGVGSVVSIFAPYNLRRKRVKKEKK